MGFYTLKPKAQADLDQIWYYTLDQWGIDQAEFYNRQLRQHIELVAERPMLGCPCPEVRIGYYKYLSGSHFIFYRVVDKGIDIVRILHERMNFRAHL